MSFLVFLKIFSTFSNFRSLIICIDLLFLIVKFFIHIHKGIDFLSINKLTIISHWGFFDLWSFPAVHFVHRCFVWVLVLISTGFPCLLLLYFFLKIFRIFLLICICKSCIVTCEILIWRVHDLKTLWSSVCYVLFFLLCRFSVW